MNQTLTTLTIVKAIVRISFMGYTFFSFIYILVVEFGVYVAHRNLWGINEDPAAALLLSMMGFMALLAFLVVGTIDQE